MIYYFLNKMPKSPECNYVRQKSAPRDFLKLKQFEEAMTKVMKSKTRLITKLKVRKVLLLP